jgi:hypothetical protein
MRGDEGREKDDVQLRLKGARTTVVPLRSEHGSDAHLSLIEHSLGNNDLCESCEVSRLAVGGGKRGASGPGSISSGENASASSWFGGMICRGPVYEALALLPEASATPIGPGDSWEECGTST